MDSETLGRCSEVIACIRQCKNVGKVLDYFLLDEDVNGIIKNRMCLDTMHNKLREGSYVNIEGLQQDFYLMCANIIACCDTGIEASFALELRDIFTVMMSSINSSNFKENLQVFREHVNKIQLSSGQHCEMTWAEISQIGERLNNIRDPKSLNHINKWLISMVPRLRGQSRSIDLCTLPDSILQGLKQELDELEL